MMGIPVELGVPGLVVLEQLTRFRLQSVELECIDRPDRVGLDGQRQHDLGAVARQFGPLHRNRGRLSASRKSRNRCSANASQKLVRLDHVAASGFVSRTVKPLPCGRMATEWIASGSLPLNVALYDPVGERRHVEPPVGAEFHSLGAAGLIPTVTDAPWHSPSTFSSGDPHDASVCAVAHVAHEDLVGEGAEYAGAVVEDRARGTAARIVRQPDGGPAVRTEHPPPALCSRLRMAVEPAGHQRVGQLGTSISHPGCR